MYGMGDDMSRLYQDVKELKEALQAIVDIQKTYKRLGIGYDIAVNTIAKQALKIDN